MSTWHLVSILAALAVGILYVGVRHFVEEAERHLAVEHEDDSAWLGLGEATRYSVAAE